jgi:hypothetical protein
MCRSYRIEQVFSSAYLPRTQGTVERMNGTIKQSLRAYTKNSGKDWDRNLQAIVFAINTAESYSTGYSPHLLIHGQRPRLPTDATLPDPEDQAQTVEQHFSQLVKTQFDCHHKALESIKAAQADMKARYDRRTKDVPFQVGSIVYLKVNQLKPHTKKSLAPKFSGPFLIVKFTTPTTVTLKRLSDSVILRKSITISRLKNAEMLRPRLKKAQLRLSGKIQQSKPTKAPTPLEKDTIQERWAPKSFTLDEESVLHPVKKITRAAKVEDQLSLELEFKDGDRRWLSFHHLPSEIQSWFNEVHKQGHITITHKRPLLRKR